MLPLRDHNPSRHLPLLTLGLAAASGVGFWLELASPDLEAFIGRWALTPAAVDLADPATLLPFLTSMFLHGGWFHLLSNMWFLWIFGDNIEDRLGRVRYLVLYLGSGIVAGLTQYAVSTGSTIPMLGASGAVAGVLGAYLVFFPHARVDTLIPVFGFVRIVPLPAIFMLGYWFLIQFLSGLGSLAIETAASGGIAFWAHIGGFAAGVLGALLFRR